MKRMIGGKRTWMKIKFMAVLCTLLVSTSGWCLASIPQTINFQGRLTDNSGTPLPDGNYSIRIFIYDQPDGAYGNRAALWSDLFDAKTKNGYFCITLGSANPLSNVAFNQPLYIGIKVGTDNEMKPCQSLNSVPYAMTAMTAFNGVPIGTIVCFAGNESKVPMGWMLCDGRAITAQAYPDLYNVIGSRYGDGSYGNDGKPAAGCDFNLPDLRSRVAVGAGAGNGGGAEGNGVPMGGDTLTNRILGSWFGEETHALSIAEMPTHNHGGSTGAMNLWTGNSGPLASGPGGYGVNIVEQHSHTIPGEGEGAAHGNLQPSLAVNYIIKCL